MRLCGWGLLDVFQTLVEVVEGLLSAASAVGEVPVFSEFQQEAFAQFLDGLFKGAEKLPAGKAARRGAFPVGKALFAVLPEFRRWSIIGTKNGSREGCGA